MTGAEIFARLGAELAAHWLFWLLLAASLALVTLASLCCFQKPKQTLRAFIAGALAFECAALMCAGWMT